MPSEKQMKMLEKLKSLSCEKPMNLQFDDIMFSVDKMSPKSFTFKYGHNFSFRFFIGGGGNDGGKIKLKIFDANAVVNVYYKHKRAKTNPYDFVATLNYVSNDQVDLAQTQETATKYIITTIKPNIVFSFNKNDKTLTITHKKIPSWEAIILPEVRGLLIPGITVISDDLYPQDGLALALEPC